MSYMHTYPLEEQHIPEENKELYNKVKKAYADFGLSFCMLWTDGYRTKGRTTYHFSVYRDTQPNEPVDERLNGHFTDHAGYTLYISEGTVSFSQQNVLSLSVEDALNYAMLVIKSCDTPFYDQHYQYRMVKEIYGLLEQEREEIKEKVRAHLLSQK